MSKLQLPKLIPYDVLTKYSTKMRNITFHAIDVTDVQGLICVGTVGNTVPILIFRWERRSHTYPYFPVGMQFLQRSVTISIRPILVAQQTTILPLINVFIFLRSVLLIKLGHGLLKQAVAGRARSLGQHSNSASHVHVHSPDGDTRLS